MAPCAIQDGGMGRSSCGHTQPTGRTAMHAEVAQAGGYQSQLDSPTPGQKHRLSIWLFQWLSCGFKHPRCMCLLYSCLLWYQVGRAMGKCLVVKLQYRTRETASWRPYGSGRAKRKHHHYMQTVQARTGAGLTSIAPHACVCADVHRRIGNKPSKSEDMGNRAPRLCKCSYLPLSLP